MIHWRPYNSHKCTCRLRNPPQGLDDLIFSLNYPNLESQIGYQTEISFFQTPEDREETFELQGIDFSFPETAEMVHAVNGSS